MAWCLLIFMFEKLEVHNKVSFGNYNYSMPRFKVTSRDDAHWFETFRLIVRLNRLETIKWIACFFKIIELLKKYVVMTRKYNKGAKCYQTRYHSGEKESSL